jgi:hypothetical protein
VASCGAITANGNRCTARVRPGAEWCYNHDPARSQERKRNASRAAKSRGGGEITDLKAQLEDLATDALEGKVERGVAAVVNQIINTRVRLLEAERKIREQEELVERLETLEEALAANARNGGSRWGG